VLGVHTSQTFSATAYNAAGAAISSVTFVWSSSNTAVATIDQNGRATAIDTGRVQIAASAQGISGLANLSVTPVAIGSIVIAPSTATMRVATTLQITDTVKDMSGNVLQGRTITWATDSPGIVSVDGNGLATARSLGTAHITATAAGKSAPANIAVSAVPVASVVITPSAPSIYIGQSAQLAAVTKDSAGNVLTSRTVRWNSRNPAAATIDSVSGIVTGVAAGSSQIVATSEGLSATVTATVTAAPANSVVLSPAVVQVHVGQTTTVVATVTDINSNPIADPTVTFSSSAPGVAAIARQSGDTAQVLAGPAIGTATILGSYQGHTGQSAFLVSAVGVDSVHVGAPLTMLTVGQSERLTATAYDSSGHPLTGTAVKWSSANPAVATITATGVATALVPGITAIFAQINGGIGSVVLTMNAAPVGSIVVVPAADTIAIGGQTQLSDTVKDVNGNVLNTPVTWVSSNTSVAFVSSAGQVLSRAAGMATITAVAGGKVGSNLTVVVDTTPANITLEISPDSIVAIPNPLDVLIQLTATVTTASGHVLSNYPVIFTSTNARVSGTLGAGPDTVIGGSILIIPDGNGRAVITATAGQLTAHAPLTVCYVASSPICDPLDSIQVVPSADTLAVDGSVLMEAIGIDSSGNAYPNMFVEWDPGPVIASDSSRVIVVAPNGAVYALNPGTQDVYASIQGYFNQAVITVVPAPSDAVIARGPHDEARRARLIGEVALARRQAVSARSQRREQMRAQLASTMRDARSAGMRAYYRRVLARIQGAALARAPE
jgi:uncharacterized protein YjdB